MRPPLPMGRAAPGGRDPRVIVAGIPVILAVVLRLLVIGEAMPWGLQPVGPDATDWVLSLRQHLDLPPLGGGHRYPLVPWLGALLSRLGLAPVSVLVLLQLLATSALAGGTALLARALAAPPGAPADRRAAAAGLVAGITVALAPLLLTLGVSTSAYGSFPLAWLALCAGLLGLAGPAGPLLAAMGALAAAATLHQGLLLCLAALPAGLLAGRYRATLAAAMGAGLGVGLAFLLDPGLRDPVGWMLQETAEYLGGNVAEEQARVGAGYAVALLAWIDQLGLGRAVLAPLILGLAALGSGALLGAGLRRPGERRRALGTGWLLAPLLPLGLLLASVHHLAHLVPLLVAAAAAGGARVLGSLPRPAAGLGGGLAVAVVLLALGRSLSLAVGWIGVEARQQAAVAEAVGALFGDRDFDVAVVVGEGWGAPPPRVVRGAWAVEPGQALVGMIDHTPVRQQALAAWLLDRGEAVGLYPSAAQAAPVARMGLGLTPTAPAWEVAPGVWAAPIGISADRPR